MPELLRSSERVGCGATIQLNAGEICIVSLARNGVLVRGYRPGLWGLLGSFLGPVLFQERDPHRVLRIARMLPSIHEPNLVPVEFNSLLLSMYANAIWRCSSWQEVADRLNETAAKV